MPELPEVETTRRGIEPFLVGRTVRSVSVRERRLRWPIPESIEEQLPGQVIDRVTSHLPPVKHLHELSHDGAVEALREIHDEIAGTRSEPNVVLMKGDETVH